MNFIFVCQGFNAIFLKIIALLSHFFLLLCPHILGDRTGNRGLEPYPDMIGMPNAI